MTQKERTLALLQNAGSFGVTNDRFIEEGIRRYSARIADLRDDGFKIDSNQLSGGCWRFVLRSGSVTASPDDPSEGQLFAAPPTNPRPSSAHYLTETA